MRYEDLSKSELAGILDLIQATVTSRNDDDINRVVIRLKEMVNADNCVVGFGDQAGNIEKIINLSYPVEWMERYATEELYKKDPIVRYNYKHFKTHLWSDALDIYSGKPYRELMNMASDYGLNYGLASGVKGESCNNSSIISFSSSVNRFGRHHVRILDIMTPHLHQALVRLSSSASPRIVRLSRREREVIRWIHEGKTNWEISMILNISERTVKFHVQNIEKKLNAVSKTHALAIAIASGLVA